MHLLTLFHHPEEHSPFQKRPPLVCGAFEEENKVNYNFIDTCTALVAARESNHSAVKLTSDITY